MTEPSPVTQAEPVVVVKQVVSAVTTEGNAAPSADPPTPADNGSSPAQRSIRDQQLQLNAGIHRLLSILVVGGVIYTAYLASELILPILLAAFFALLLSPLMKRLSRLWLPRWLGAFVLVAMFIGLLIGIGNALYPSASEWAARAPKVMQDAKPRLKELVQPILNASKMTASFGDITDDGANRNARYVLQAPSHANLLSTTPKILASLLAVVLLTYFFLVYSDTLLRKVLQLSPTWSKKRLTVDIVRAIQSDVSRYVLTICVTSLALGIATTAYLWMLGVETPWLWGAIAALLNLAPYVGPLLMAGLLCLVGLSQFPTIGAAILPAAGYLALHVMEGQGITPLALGKTINLNPLAIIVWLMIWGWLWGIIGLLLAVPMLVCLKIVCSRIEGLQRWAILLEK